MQELGPTVLGRGRMEEDPQSQDEALQHRNDPIWGTFQGFSLSAWLGGLEMQRVLQHGESRLPWLIIR